MKYISCIHALNLPCSLETCGDWHTSALQWERPQIRESDNSIFGDYGIEICSIIPENPGTYHIANTLRALLDLLAEGNFGIAQGAKEDFICNDKYTQEFMEKVYMLRDMKHWNKINEFMKREYMFEWDEYVASQKEEAKNREVKVE